MRTEVKYGVSDQIPLARQVACSLLRLLRDPRDRTLGPLKSITAVRFAGKLVFHPVRYGGDLRRSAGNLAITMHIIVDC